MTRTTTLTFSRKDGESLILDHDIIVTVHHCRAGKAKVTIVSPENVDIMRAELLDDHAAAD
ncbi:carbon storage regulator [Marinobacterium sp. BA1]|uniref:carbon storage regulator n=1 Tax=Marinobacterium sp. BA1 TaxID=3138931 RepID=UPI0032E535CF